MFGGEGQDPVSNAREDDDKSQLKVERMSEASVKSHDTQHMEEIVAWDDVSGVTLNVTLNHRGEK